MIRVRVVPHVHVSEREGAHVWPDGRLDDAAWEDCLWSSAVEWVRALGRAVPATHAEAEGLRAASGQGPLGGSTLDDLRRGLDARYRLAMPAPVSGAAAVVAALEPGMAAVVTGSLGGFPAGHRLRRWQPGFTGGHAVYLERGLDGTWLWCDPLAPVGASPDRVAEADVRTFAWSAVVGRVAFVEREEVTMFPIVTREPFPAPVRFVIPAGTTLPGYDPASPGRPVKTASWPRESSAHATARVAVRWVGVDPAAAPVPRGAPFLEVADGVYAGLLVVERFVRLDPLPDPCTGPVAEARRAVIAAAIAALEGLGR